MQGTRLPNGTDWNSTLPNGSYWKLNDIWYCITPNNLFGNLSGHKVVEHEDGTITVSPSIFVNMGRNPNWHGFLEHGIWRSC